MTDGTAPGPVVLFGGGETSRAAGEVYASLLRSRRGGGAPRVAVLETPAGFEPNSSLVAERVASFLRRRLASLDATVTVVPARKRGTAASPDDPSLLPEILRADLAFLGPGSPTYAVRQLRGSAAWHAVEARRRLGGCTVLASAAMVAAGALALPVYEIYKVGEEPHWKEGLDLLGAHGLPLVLVPHWNNRDGGAELDTRRCYLGVERFDVLRRLLPPGHVVLGVDEGTAVVLDLAAGTAEVKGEGSAVIVRPGEEEVLRAPAPFPLSRLGPFRPDPGRGPVPPGIWEAAAEALLPPPLPAAEPVPPEVLALVEAREEARRRREWGEADELRGRIASAGWGVTDSPDGPRVEALPREGTPGARPGSPGR